jgi:hypothetical protein
VWEGGHPYLNAPRIIEAVSLAQMCARGERHEG